MHSQLTTYVALLPVESPSPRRARLQRRRAGAAVLALFLVAAALLSNACRRQPDTVLTIGVVFPITGDASFWGKNAERGVRIAADTIADAGLLGESRLELVVEDSRSTADGAVSAARKLIDQNGVRFIVGDLVSSNLVAMAPVVSRESVLTVGLGSTPKLRIAGDYVFRTWPSDDLQGRAVADILTRQSSDAATIGLVFVNNEYGQGVADVVSATWNGEITMSEAYDKTVRDFRGIVLRVLDADINWLVLVSYPEELPILLRQLNEAGYSGTVVGTETFQNDDILSNKYGFDVFFTLPDLERPSSVATSFRDAYVARYGEEPGVPARPAHDALWAIAHGISAVGADPQKVRQFLLEVKNLEAASGILSFDKHGDVLTPFLVKSMTAGAEVQSGWTIDFSSEPDRAIQ